MTDEADHLRAEEAAEVEADQATGQDAARFEKARADLLREIALNSDLLREIQYNKFKFFEPTPKQTAFLWASKDYRVLGLTGGNGTGKTQVGSFATVCHLTGAYPAGWQGHDFGRPINALVASR